MKFHLVSDTTVSTSSSVTTNCAWSNARSENYKCLQVEEKLVQCVGIDVDGGGSCQLRVHASCCWPSIAGPQCPGCGLKDGRNGNSVPFWLPQRILLFFVCERFAAHCLRVLFR
jgi:hypothetical protein